MSISENEEMSYDKAKKTRFKTYFSRAFSFQWHYPRDFYAKHAISVWRDMTHTYLFRLFLDGKAAILDQFVYH